MKTQYVIDRNKRQITIKRTGLQKFFVFLIFLGFNILFINAFKYFFSSAVCNRQSERCVQEEVEIAQTAGLFAGWIGSIWFTHHYLVAKARQRYIGKFEVGDDQ
ncbi:hypothetical protein [Fischerella sp. PCC 9605]|uniref:hypothetical protein n=1 Tax=Fischerella sp. PCC 9605 TaxID=1173024 RepID=UPI000479CEC8|nr:hypothetical protein [Fischerella sp. PCC 9605]